jgi:hypothetical protein
MSDLRETTGAKRMEIRFDDRGYRVGDELTLREWDPGTLVFEIGSSGRYTGRVCHRTVTHLLHGGQFGLAEGYVALSLDVDLSGSTEQTATQALAVRSDT